MRRRLWTAAVGVMTVAALACGGGDDTAGQPGAADTTGAATPPATPPPATGAATLPEGVTQEMVTAGQAIFTGQGLCYTCHTAEGTGTEGLAPDLTDQTWINIDGSYEQIVQTVTNGVPQPKEHPAPMPPMGGAQLTDEQIHQVAGYVYSLSHGG